MTTGEKIAGLRKENNYTQEQLADILGVSRQSVSKWESDAAYPETEKLVKMGRLFGCSMDYLLNEECTEKNVKSEPQPPAPAPTYIYSVQAPQRKRFSEKKSEKMIFGMPLYHIGKNAKGFFAIGLNAKGVIAIGLLARGVLSIGLLSIGIFSFGFFVLGLLAFGLFSVGGLAFGSISLGIIAIGAISFGVLSVGGVAIGEFALGACAVGKYVAVGDSAQGMIAIGKSEAFGSVYSVIGEVSKEDVQYITTWLDDNVPAYLNWAKNFMVNLMFSADFNFRIRF